MNVKLLTVLAAILVMTAMSASAAVIDLTFEGIDSYPHPNDVQILEFYNGGFSSVGSTGPNYGVSFPTNALNICLNTTSTFCSNTSRGGLGDPNSQLGALFFLSGSNTFVNVAAGFDTGFAFNYTAINVGGTVNVWSGLNGTGAWYCPQLPAVRAVDTALRSVRLFQSVLPSAAQRCRSTLAAPPTRSYLTM